MSWFDATGFANLAKSALKEAQKTIDKALDIKDEEEKVIQTHTDEASDFFTTWDFKTEEESSSQSKGLNPKQANTSSIWGSFTGSFFEIPKFGDKSTTSNIKHSKSLQGTSSETLEKCQLTPSASLPDSLTVKEVEKESVKNSEGSSVCVSKVSFDKLDVNISAKSPNNEIPLDEKHLSVNKDNNKIEKHETEEDTTKCNTNEDDSQNMTDAFNIKDNKSNVSENEVEEQKKEVHQEELTTCNTLNRISVISSDSDKKSLESVEILGSQSNTDCTTTPESDGNSVSDSIGPCGVGLKVNSESVEILPDSLVTSPSSVEILGEWKSDSSPNLSPIEQKHSESSSILDRDDSITPCGDNINMWGEEDNNIQKEVSSFDISPNLLSTEKNQTDPNSASSTSLPDTSITSQTSNSLSVIDSNKASPESVEIIPDVDELDELSLAEDSYTSASESTVMTIMETFQQYDQTRPKLDFTSMNVKMHESYQDSSKQVLLKSSTESQLTTSLDSLKEKHNLHLPIEPITTQPIYKPEPLESVNKIIEVDPFSQLMSTTIEPPEIEGDVENERLQRTESVECTDQVLILTDSSCEGTLIESSSEDNATLVSSVATKVVETHLTSSSYVKTMLADAMVEKHEIIDVQTHSAGAPRENSPISSESRSDLVKIGSDQTSGHTSGDEIETTTSSDIEVISSPNGDSSSTQSRQSPAKLQTSKGNDLLTKTLKTRGHSRELSEISIGSDETNLEIEKLLKRIQEMTEVLEARESKLIDVSRINMELHEQNSNLRKQLDSFEKRAEQSQSLNQITDEYTQRLSALERKFQQAIRERDTLRKNLDQLKQEAATRLSSQEMSTINAEKDEIIKELREEGEKLSKQQLTHSNIIKKLRAKEKENDALIKHQKEVIEEQTSELERLKRSLYAKEEVERTQIEAVHTLTAKTKKQEKEILTLQEKLDNTMHKMDAYKKSLEAAKLELAETKKNLVTTEQELKEAVDSASESCQLFAQVEELKIKLRQTEEANVKKEEFHKHVNNSLLKRLEEAETRSEELSESISTATKPLLRQLEQLQANLVHKSNTFMKQEKVLNENNAELQTKLENLLEVDRGLKEENINLKAKISHLESKINAKEAEKEQLENQIKKLTEENKTLADESLRHQQNMEMLQQTHSNQIKEFKREINALENKVAIERAATDAEKRKNHAMLEQQQSIDEELRLSPTLSIERDSVSSASSVWPAFSDSVFDNGSGRFPVAYGNFRAGTNSTSVVENLQAQLKQRDGEIQQLQWELSRRNTERDALNTELSALTLKMEILNNQVEMVEALNENIKELQTRYDALLQMYGEKVEEYQELRLDLEDITDMYKSQIEQLLKKDT
ncbi:PREDICTED: TATA element modulatory factor-like isoform X2 [Polistes dominula]|uniref:TATA element modulatory factor-like isoform X2 n=1 Tax=Polistes dominula TaxID=743375 RepID=A0ABM1I709_POLDO|nr:PREDICTED: TATA element modulatory factor-like isoform X2 [Polistes dominula]